MNNNVIERSAGVIVMPDPFEEQVISTFDTGEASFEFVEQTKVVVIHSCL